MGLILPLVTAAPALLAADAPFSPSQTVIVTAQKSPVMADDQTLATVTSGTILHYAEENGSWLMIPRYGAWIKRTEVLPIEKAEEHYSALLERSPTAEAFEHRGNARFALGRNDEAIKDFDEALRLQPKTASIYIHRGIAQQHAGRTELALTDYTEALKLIPDDQAALIRRGKLLIDLEQFEAATVDIDHLLKVNPNSPEGHNLRGIVLQVDGHFADALVEFDQAIEKYPRYAEAYSNRGYVHKQMDNFEAAVQDYEKAIELDSTLPEPLNDAAWLLATCRDEKYRDPEKSVTFAEKARTLSAEPSSDVLDTLAAAYAAAGRFDEAVATAEEAVKRAPDEHRSELVSRAELYRSGKPFVEN
jgi:tetratricopeptide (TPR) repeat protein